MKVQEAEAQHKRLFGPHVQPNEGPVEETGFSENFRAAMTVFIDEDTSISEYLNSGAYRERDRQIDGLIASGQVDPANYTEKGDWDYPRLAYDLKRHGFDIRDDYDVRSEIRETLARQRDVANDIHQRSTMAGSAGIFAGQMVGAAVDPINAGFMMIPGLVTIRMGTAMARAGKAAAYYGASGVASESIIQASYVQDWKEKIGLEYTAGDSLEAIAWTGVGSAVFGTAVEGALTGARFTYRHVKQGFKNTRARIRASSRTKGEMQRDLAEVDAAERQYDYQVQQYYVEQERLRLEKAREEGRLTMEEEQAYVDWANEKMSGQQQAAEAAGYDTTRPLFRGADEIDRAAGVGQDWTNYVADPDVAARFAGYDPTTGRGRVRSHRRVGGDDVGPPHIVEKQLEDIGPITKSYLKKDADIKQASDPEVWEAWVKWARENNVKVMRGFTIDEAIEEFGPEFSQFWDWVDGQKVVRFMDEVYPDADGIILRENWDGSDFSDNAIFLRNKPGLIKSAFEDFRSKPKKEKLSIIGRRGPKKIPLKPEQQPGAVFEDVVSTNNTNAKFDEEQNAIIQQMEEVDRLEEEMMLEAETYNEYESTPDPVDTPDTEDTGNPFLDFDEDEFARMTPEQRDEYLAKALGEDVEAVGDMEVQVEAGLDADGNLMFETKTRAEIDNEIDAEIEKIDEFMECWRT